MNYYKIFPMDTTNGIGIRVILWICGCTLKCKNCHNQELQSFSSGTLFTDETKQKLFKSLDKPYIDGITLTGGHPFEEQNLLEVLQLVKEIKEKFPKKTIWIYTGFTWEEILSNPTIKQILQYTDVLVDGRYIEEQRDLSLNWRGSKNQRVIDVQQSLQRNKIILYCD